MARGHWLKHAQLYFEDPRKGIGRLYKIAIVLLGYFYLYSHQNILCIDVQLVSVDTLLQMPIIAAFLLPTIHYVIASADPLQRSPWRLRSIRFFQNELPSKYILNRCKQCVENEFSCLNYITPESGAQVRVWLEVIFHGRIEKENPQIIQETFRKGYTCKLVFYLSWFSMAFAVLSIVTVFYYQVHLYFTSKPFEVKPPQVLFFFGCLTISIIVSLFNSPNDKKPSGCWHAWREINRSHVRWLRHNEQFLVDEICKANNNTKVFKTADQARPSST